MTPLCIDERIAAILARLGADAIGLLLDLPLAVSPSIAAALTGRSPKAVRGAVDRGELLAYGRTHRRIPLNALAAWTGRDVPFTADELLSAFARISHRAVPTPLADGGDCRGYRDKDLY